MRYNWLLDVDSYKVSHYAQYPPGTEFMFSYGESRGGKFPKTVFFGLQYILQEYLSKPITKEDVIEAADLFNAHGVPFNRDGFMHIVEKHGGFPAVKIRAVPEGTVVPTHNVLFTVESTCKECFWVVGYIETLLMRVWYPTTVATLSHRCKSIISDWLKKTADDESGLPFKLHDFGARGVSSQESAAIGGAAHLVNFMGSDTFVAVTMLIDHYGANMPAFSIPAAEHSTITSWGRINEVDAYANMLDKFAKKGSLLAVVSDSYNIELAVRSLWGKLLKNKVIESGATLVVRPDSGVPWEVCVQVTQWLDEAFGHTVNSKGYKVLNHVRVIYGDGINEESINRICYDMAEAGYSTDNVAFGMGGALLQQCNRDTNKFAFKCSAVEIDGEMRDVFKSPITDGGKMSKRGVLDLVDNNPDGTKFQTIAVDKGTVSVHSALNDVYINGQLYNRQTLEEIRRRTWK